MSPSRSLGLAAGQHESADLHALAVGRPLDRRIVNGVAVCRHHDQEPERRAGALDDVADQVVAPALLASSVEIARSPSSGSKR